MCGRGKPIRYSRAKLTWAQYTLFMGHRVAHEIAQPQSRHWSDMPNLWFLMTAYQSCIDLKEV